MYLIKNLVPTVRLLPHTFFVQFKIVTLPAISLYTNNFFRIFILLLPVSLHTKEIEYVEKLEYFKFFEYLGIYAIISSLTVVRAKNVLYPRINAASSFSIFSLDLRTLGLRFLNFEILTYQ
jgi:hypothetical protein